MTIHHPFPPELIDLIVREQEDDTDTLRRCTLVSKSFLLPAQKLLFHYVDFDVAEDDRGSRRRYRRFRHISTVNPRLMTYVRELHILDNSILLDPPDDPRPSWIRDEEDFPEFLKSLPNLERLTFETDLYWDSFPPNLATSLFDVLHGRNIQYLGLHGVQDVPQSVCVAFKNVQELSLWAMTVNVDEDEEDDMMLSPLAAEVPRTHWLGLQMLDGATESAVLKALVTPGTTLPALKTLTIGPFNNEEVAGAWEVMKAARNAVESFSLEYNYNTRDLPPIILSPFNLAGFEKLVHISYRVTYSSESEVPSPNPFAGLLGLLETLTSENTIKFLSITVDSPDSAVAMQQLNSYVGWDTLGSVLRGSRFAGLHSVWVHITPYKYKLATGSPMEDDTDGLDDMLERLEELACAKLAGLEDSGKTVLSVVAHITGF